MKMKEVKNIYIPGYECCMCGFMSLDKEKAEKCYHSHFIPEHVMGYRFQSGQKAPEKVVLMDANGSSKYLYKLDRKLDEEEDW